MLSLLMITVSSRAVTESSTISHFYDTDQLSSNLITSICQDKQGYIWVATEYGLNRFDGVHFTNYYADDDTAQPLLNNNCRKVICDNDGRVWVISYMGMQYYDRLNNTFPSIELNTATQSYPTDIIVMNDGRLLVLTIRYGLYFIDTKNLKATPYDEANKLYVDSTASCMFEDSKGRIWICSDKTGLTQLDVKNKRFEHFDRSQLKSDGVNAVSEDGEGRVIVLSRSKVLLYNETTKKLEEIGNTNGLYLRTLFRNKDGKVLLGTYGDGVMQVDVDSNLLLSMFQQTSDGVQLAKQSVQAYLEDSQNNQWIGCLRAGVALVTNRRQPFTYFNLQSLPDDNGGTLSMLSYDDGQFLLGQENNGLMDIKPNGKVTGHRFAGEYILAHQKMASGSSWLGSYGKGLRISRNGTAAPEVVDSLRGKRIKDFALDRDGNLYMAIFDYGLLSFYPDGTPRLFDGGRLKLNNRYLNKLFLDSKGWLWIGHYNGIDVYDPETERLVDVPVDSILRPSHTFAITESRDGMVWVGTNHGLFCYDRDKNQWQHYDKRDGLCNEIVCGIVEDEKGDLWLSTYHGLSHLIRKEGRFVNYYKGNGLQSSSYIRGIYGKTPDGLIYFGNDRGVTSFYPSQVTNTEFQRGLSLTGLFVAGKEVGTDGKNIRLGYQDNTFTLRFSTMDFREAANIQYEYRFADEGKDVWHQLSPGISDVTISHLRFGSHVLEVRAMENGVYSPVERLSIHITPPWYRSWWAYIIYILLVIAVAIMLLLNIRHKQMADMNEEKIKFFVDISHELRSPLTLIKSPIDKLLHSVSDPSQVRALRNIERNTNRLLTLTNQILSIRKIEKGQMTLHFAETPLGEFVSDICHDYDYQLEKRKISLTIDIQAPDMKVWIDRDNFDKVVTNLLSNAIKYVEDGGKIEVTVSNTPEGRAELAVRDNGQGIDEAQLRKVFERFYQASARPAAGQMSYGIGLNLTQKIVTLHHGNISAHNRTDVQGSEFIVSLPLGSAHLPQEQLVSNEYYAPATTTQEKQTQLTTDADSPRRVRKKTTYRVAVVDDDDEIRNFLKTELGESYYVQTYPDGQKALEGIVETVPDLVISDVVMPKMDGFELLRRLKGSTNTSHVPVILLTTKTEHQSRVEGLEHGADAYVDKPFNLEELEARIASLIANRIRIKGKFSGVQEQEDTVRKVELKGNDAALMERIMKAINERLDDSDFNVEALADEVGLSRVQLHRRMKELTGITVGEFIRNLRLQQAAKLLAQGDTTISQVTYAVGFSNPTHFASAFKKSFGVTPSEYMTKHQSKEQH